VSVEALLALALHYMTHAASRGSITSPQPWQCMGSEIKAQLVTSEGQDVNAMPQYTLLLMKSTAPLFVLITMRMLIDRDAHAQEDALSD
jgi:hypothetical protein